MKKISDYIKSLGFTFSFRRLKKAILLILLFILIGTIVFLSYNYKNSKAWLEKVYKKEVASKFDIGDRTIIKILKEDVTLDRKTDYIYIAGKKTKSNDGLSNSTIEQYENVILVLIDGNTNIAVPYDTKKKFAEDVTLKFCNDEENIYYMISDTSGNVSLCKFENQELQDINNQKITDIILNTTPEFLGYTIYIEELNESKLKVTLDNYNKEYLDSYTDEKVLDFSENGIDISRYRETYLRDKFSNFELKDTNNDGILEFVGYQYLLYSLDDKDNKTLGIIQTVFTMDNENKLKFSHVDISII